MKHQRLNAIRELVGHGQVANQDDLRLELVGLEALRSPRRTLSRDIHELRLSKGPGGYSLSNGNSATAVAEDNSPPSVAEMIESFGLRVRQAMNQVVVGTVTGGSTAVGRGPGPCRAGATSSAP